MRITVLNMRITVFLSLVLSMLFNPVFADDLDVLRLSESNRNQLFNYLENNSCTCGCGMGLGVCLRDDPACPVSPELARSAIKQLTNPPQPSNQSNEQSGQQGSSSYINNSQNGSVVSGKVNGQDCTYVTAGGMTVRDCD